MSTPVSLNSRIASILGGLAVASALLTGCANMVTTATDIPTNATATITGMLYGGSTAIGGATVKLYAVGTTGYGSAGTLLATTSTATTGTVGSFSFSQTSGTPSGNQYACPSSSTQVYILANGGNTGSGTNSAAVFLTALGTCPTPATASTVHVNLNEAVTAANAYALSQYISPGTTPGTESLGTSGSTQSSAAFANAVAGLSNLIGSNGGPALAFNRAGVNPTVSGITMAVYPETSKLVTIADILAACVDTASNASSACTDLFGNVTLPLNATVTSQPSATYATPQDTLQAAYYLAVTPANAGTFTANSCVNTPSATSRTGCLFGLVTGSSPYQTALSAAPVDWTVSVNYLASGTCSGGGYFIAGPYHSAIDASGNVWFINGGSVQTNISEMSPTGVPLTCVGNLPNGRGLTIDVNGNVWGSFNGTAAAGDGIYELPVGSSTLTQWVSAATYEMTADGFGNVFYNTNGSGGSISELVNAANASTVTAPVVAAGPLTGTGTVTQGYIQVDSLGRIWDATSSANDFFVLAPGTQAAITGYQVTGGSVTFTATNSYTPGQLVQVRGLTTAEGRTLDNQTYTVTSATASNFVAATTAATIAATTDTGTSVLAGSYALTTLTTQSTSYGVAIDSNNYVYQGTTCCSGTTFREAVKWTPASTLSSSTYTASTQDFAGINGVRSLVVDGASNVFVGNEYPNSSGATATTGTYSISEFTTSGSGNTATFTSLSPAGTVPGTCSTSAGCATGGGFFDTGFNEPFDMQVDASGNLWVMDSGTAASATVGNTITELVGVAVPVVTPLSVAVRNGQLGTKP